MHFPGQPKSGVITVMEAMPESVRIFFLRSKASRMELGFIFWDLMSL